MSVNKKTIVLLLLVVMRNIGALPVLFKINMGSVPIFPYIPRRFIMKRGILLGILAIIFMSQAAFADIEFYEAQTFATGSGPQSVFAVDLDGDVDLATANSWSNNVSILKNITTPTTHTLAITKSGTGSGTVTSLPAGIDCGLDCSESYNSGTLLTLSATPDTGSIFTGWSGDADCSDGQVTMDEDKTCTATFNIVQYTQTVIKAGMGSGKVIGAGIDCGNDCTESYNYGTLVLLGAVTDTGSIFAGFSGDCGGIMYSDKICTATWTLLTYYIVTPSAGPGGSIIPAIPQIVNYGSTTVWTITPDTGYSIASVTGCGGALFNNTYTTGAITADCTVTATFSKDLYLVWSDNTDGNYEIHFKKSTNNGVTWTANKRMTNNSGTSNSPSIAADGANIYLIWSDTTFGNSEILFKGSTDGGNTWSAIKRLTNNIGSSILPDITVSGTNIYVVWSDDTYGNNEILFKKSTDGGNTWSAIKRLTNNIGISTSPSIITDGVNIYLAWQDTTFGNNEILFRKSIDRGNTWSAIQRITNNIGWSTTPVIKANGSGVYLTWTDDTYGNNEILFRSSPDGENTWTAIKRLTNNTGFSGYQTIKTYGINLYLIWQDTTLGNTEILFRKSTDGGTTWSAIKRLTNNTGLSQYPSISIDMSNIYISWQDTTFGNSEILFKGSADGGNTWSAIKRLTNNIGLSETPVMP